MTTNPSAPAALRVAVAALGLLPPAVCTRRWRWEHSFGAGAAHGEARLPGMSRARFSIALWNALKSSKLRINTRTDATTTMHQRCSQTCSCVTHKGTKRHEHKRAHIHACKHTHMYKPVHMLTHARTHAHTHALTLALAHTPANTRARTHTHTRTHTDDRTPISAPQPSLVASVRPPHLRSSIRASATPARVVVQAAQEQVERVRRAAEVEIAAMKVRAASRCCYSSGCCVPTRCLRDCV